MARLCTFTGALLASRAIANVPSCHQADETTLLQGFVRQHDAQSSQPKHADASQSLHSNVQSLQRSPQIPNPEAGLSAWAAQNPIVALKLGEVPPDEVANVVEEAGFVPEATEAINEFIDEHGGAAFQEWVRGVLSPQFSYTEPDLPDFTEPTAFTALIPVSQILSHPNRLATQVLDETIYGDIGGRVLDGSMANYFYRPGTSNLLVLHQDGGGSCGTDNHSQFHCNAWFQQKQIRNRQGTDGTGPLKNFVPGDFDGNTPGHLDDNHPDFGSAHKIRVPYLSGDAYMGQVVSPSNPCQSTFAPDGSYVEFADFNNCGMYQSGHLNIRNIMHHFLSNQPGSRDITRIFMTGNSAGGRSSLMNCDWLQEFMDTHGPGLHMQPVEVSCAPVAGFMLPGFTADHENPKSSPTPFPLWRDNEVSSDEASAAAFGSTFENSRSWLPRACRVAQVPGEEWRCGSATVAYPHIVPRVFIVQNKYDYLTKWMSFPMGAWNWPESLLGPHPPEDASQTCEGQEYMSYYGDAMEASVVAAKPQDGMFFASCIDHHENNELGGEAMSDWDHHKRTLVQGVDSLQAVTNWFFERGEWPNEIRDDCQSAMGVPCNPSCKKEIEDLGPSCL